MKNKIVIIFIILAFSLSFPLLCQDQSVSLFSLRAAPGINIPLGRDTELVKIGGGGYISGEFRMPFFQLLSAGIDIGYNYLPLYTDTNLSLLAFGAGAGLDIPFTSWMNLRIFGKGGYFYGLLHDSAGKGGNPYASGGLGLYFRIAEPITLGVEGAYNNYFGFYNDVGVRIGTVLNFGPRVKDKGQKTKLPSKPDVLEQKTEQGQEEGLIITEIVFEDIFPVFFKYYDNNPVGKALLINNEEVPLKEIQVSLYVKQYMDNPKECSAPGTLGPGERAEIDLNALFTERVLEISEGTKVSAQIVAQYVLDGKTYTREAIETIRLFDRNAVTWDDDRKAAAFVTAKDSAVLRFSKQVAGIIKGSAGRAVNGNLLNAVGIHSALSLYGVRYVIDPGSAYEELSQNAAAIDYLQFPRQTLEFKAGDCDDLSILYAALMESVGIETAFITVPGHIFLAFSLNEPPENARNNYLRPDELIFREDTTWVPFEVTEIEGGFLKAWELGAREWRQNNAREQAQLIPIRDAWQIYEPVGFMAEKIDMPMPEEKAIVDAFVNEVTAFIDREISPRVAKLTAEISGSNNNYKAVNRLGVLYARYGLSERAEQQFKTALKQREYVPALVNLGNIYFLENRLQEAMEYYEKAEAVSPDNPKVLLSIARINHEIENYGSAQFAYKKLKEMDPNLAARFSYLDLRGEEAVRAAEIGQVKGVVVWDEE